MPVKTHWPLQRGSQSWAYVWPWTVKVGVDNFYIKTYKHGHFRRCDEQWYIAYKTVRREALERAVKS